MEDFKKKADRQFDEMNKRISKDISDMFKAYNQMIAEELERIDNKSKKVGK